MIETMAELIRMGKPVSEYDLKKFERIKREMLDEQCEICGAKVSVCGDLFAKDSKDELGRNIVLMVCSNCFTQKHKKKTKKGDIYT